MREKPELSEEALAARLRDAYGLCAVEIAFLPLGADRHTAVFRIGADDGGTYFLKLRSGAFDDVGVVVPRLLQGRGVAPVIAPIPTAEQRLWTRIERFAMALYPFVEGCDGYASPLSDPQWLELGAALRGIHAMSVPESLARRIPRETFAPVWRDALRRFLARAERERFQDHVAAELAALLHGERGRISELVRRAEELAEALRVRAPAPVLCHGDMHAGNVLIGADGTLHLVDWDTLVWAPRERDLALIGAGWGGEREAQLFRQGYGAAEPDPAALTYYRYHRIVEDIAVTCEQLLEASDGGANREQVLGYVADALRPGGALQLAGRMDTA